MPENVPDWVLKISYLPEPPIVVRDAMNPWADERRRQVYLAEETAWKAILPLQATYRTLTALMNALVLEIQDNIRRLENLTGKKSGLSDAAGYASLVYSLAGGPYAWAATIAKFGIDIVLGIFKKKKAKKIMKRLEELGAQAQARMGQMVAVEKEVTQKIAEAEGIKAAQPGIISADIRRSEEAYQKRQEIDTTRAVVLRERIRQAAILPKRPGGPYDAL